MSTSENKATPKRVRNPHDLIHTEDVVKTLSADKGSDAQLTSFSIQDFTNEGDSFACIVTSIIVDYKIGAESFRTSYVVKMNPCRSETFDVMSNTDFEKEIGFYTQLLPLMNEELERANESPLRVPRCLHCVLELSNQVIYFEDLRKHGFKQLNRRMGMDKSHANVILRELARFHAASVLLMSRGEFQGVDMIEKFPILREAIYPCKGNKGTHYKYETLIPKTLENIAMLAEKSSGYQQVAEFLRAKKENIVELFDEQLQVTSQFQVICHGDCWSNNFLFRYSKKGIVEECRLLDMQVYRVGSPALDINFMMFMSLCSDIRKPELPSFLTNYYATFASVMAGGGVATKFTLPQLKKQFYEKNLYGLVKGVLLLPIILMEPGDTPALEDMVGENMEAQYQQIMVNLIRKNPLTKPRLLAMFDEMLESGTIS